MPAAPTVTTPSCPLHSYACAKLGAPAQARVAHEWSLIRDAKMLAGAIAYYDRRDRQRELDAYFDAFYPDITWRTLA